MSTDAERRKAVLQKLADVRMDLIETVLGSAVNREARIDLTLAANQPKQELLNNFIRGLSVLYLYSFMQSHISQSQWDDIKSVNSRQREDFTNVNWDLFDTLKYVRDCFGHDWEGALFPSTQRNTSRFMDLIHAAPNNELISVTDDRIVLSDGVPFECVRLVRSVLSEADLA